MKKAYLDDDVVSVIAKDDNGAESAALDLLLAAYRERKVDLVTSAVTLTSATAIPPSRLNPTRPAASPSGAASNGSTRGKPLSGIEKSICSRPSAKGPISSNFDQPSDMGRVS